LDCTIEYCYAHDNDGCGALLGLGIIRFSVFANNNLQSSVTGDAFGNGPINGGIVHAVASGSGSGDALIFGNTVYGGTTGEGFIVLDLGRTSPTAASHVYNNILVSKAGGRSAYVNVSYVVGNVYYATDGGTIRFQSIPAATTFTSLASAQAIGYEKLDGILYGIFADPLLLNPVSSPVALPANPVATITNFDIPNNSPAVNESVAYDLVGIFSGSTDFHNVPVLFRNAGAQQQELSVWHVAAARLAA
jgi:hypothetical protein